MDSTTTTVAFSPAGEVPIDLLQKASLVNNNNINSDSKLHRPIRFVSESTLYSDERDPIQTQQQQQAMQQRDPSVSAWFGFPGSNSQTDDDVIQKFWTCIEDLIVRSGNLPLKDVFTGPSMRQTISASVDMHRVMKGLTGFMTNVLESASESTSTISTEVKEDAGTRQARLLLILLSQFVGIVSNPLLVADGLRLAMEARVDAEVCEWIRKSFGLWEMKHAHFHGSADFSAGRLRPVDIQAFRTATYVCVRSSSSERAATAIPVFYLPMCEVADEHENTLLNYWNLIGGPLNIHSAKIRRVPTHANEETMDLAALLAFMNEDVALGRRPCFVYGRASTALSGQCDDLIKLREICDKMNCWMHIDGENLALLMATSHVDPSSSTVASPSTPRPTTTIDAARLADSITLDLASWFQPTSPAASASTPSSMTALVPVTLFLNVDPRFADSIVSHNLGPLPRSQGVTLSPVLPSSPQMSGSRSANNVASVSGFGGYQNQQGHHQMGHHSNASEETVGYSSGKNSGAGNNGVHAGAVAMSLGKRGHGSYDPLPTSLKFTLPWWIMIQQDLKGWLVHLAQAKELARTMIFKCQPCRSIAAASTSDETYLTACIRFASGSKTGGSHGHAVGGAAPFAAAAAAASASASGAGTMSGAGAGPGSSAGGPGEKKIYRRNSQLLDDAKMELLSYKTRCDKATRYIFASIPNDLKKYLGLELVTLCGYVNIRYRPALLCLPAGDHANLLLNLTSIINNKAECIESAFRFQSVFQAAVAANGSTLFNNNNLIQSPTSVTGTTGSGYIGNTGPEPATMMSPVVTSSPTGTVWGQHSETSPCVLAAGREVRCFDSALVDAYVTPLKVERSDSGEVGDGEGEGEDGTENVGQEEVKESEEQIAERIAARAKEEAAAAAPWIGLGVVQYAPAYIDLDSEALDPVVVKDLDWLNEKLAETLEMEWSERASSGVANVGVGAGVGGHGGVVKGKGVSRTLPMFSKALVKTEAVLAMSKKVSMSSSLADISNVLENENIAVNSVRFCVRVGLDDHPFTEERVKEIVDLIIRKGRELEKSPTFMETLTEVVKAGIKNAEIGLKSDMSDEMYILRSLPVIGTVLGMIGVPPSVKQTSSSSGSATNLSSSSRLSTAHTFTLSSGFSTVPIETRNDGGGRSSFSITRSNEMAGSASGINTPIMTRTRTISNAGSDSGMVSSPVVEKGGSFADNGSVAVGVGASFNSGQASDENDATDTAKNQDATPSVARTLSARKASEGRIGWFGWVRGDRSNGSVSTSTRKCS
ncbi:hypothetical protein HDU76_000396 [Blyttiomyces sp. JEL0837]|nr:hypothetical protein HDU76_000396 [Blyttiomyces sp. JEL0837]